MWTRFGSYACALILVPIFASGSPLRGEVPDRGDLEQRIDGYVHPYLERGHLSGTVLVARAWEIVYERSFGFANLEHAVPNASDTRFGAGSINKPMTVVILGRLLEAGNLTLDDKLDRFLPDFPRGEQITVGDLLRHTAGIPHRVTEAIDEIRPQTPASMVKLAAGRQLVFEPGSDNGYSSGGYSVLARVLEIAGGRSYQELLAEYVLAPAGMSDTADVGSRPILEHRASSYYFDTTGLVNAPPADISHLVGAGSVFSTPRDLLAMQQALLTGKLGERAKQALVRGDGSLRWNGSAQGYRTFADYDAGTQVAVIVASNVTSGALDRLRDALPKLAAGEEPPDATPPNATPAEVAASTLRSYEGAYELRPGRSLDLRFVDGRVMMDQWLLIPTSETTLFSPQDYAEIEVVRDEEGGVVRLDWTIGGRTFQLPRVESGETQ